MSSIRAVTCACVSIAAGSVLASPSAPPPCAAAPTSIAAAGETSVPKNFLDRPIVGEQRVLVYYVEYEADDSRCAAAAIPLTKHEQVITDEVAFFEDVEDLLEANAYGELDVEFTIAGSVASPLTMPHGLCYYSQGAEDDALKVLLDARATAIATEPPDHDWDWSNYDHEVILTPDFMPQSAGSGFNKNYRVSFCFQYPNVFGLVLHEMGHGFGFEHASYWGGSPSAANPTCCATCGCQYGDEFDVMGDSANAAGVVRHYNPRHKLWAGWIPEGPVSVPPGEDPPTCPVVTNDDDYTIRSLADQGASGYRGIRVRKDAEWTYYVFCRGFQVHASPPCLGPVYNGAIITRSRETNLRPAGNTYLLDVEGSGTWCESVLAENERLLDQTGTVDISIEVIEADPNGDTVTVRVDFGDDGGTITQQPAIDELPIVDVLTPAPGAILDPDVFGVIRFEVTAYDPDHGNANWDGIEKVIVGVDLLEGCDPKYHSFGVFTPPETPENVIVWDFDVLQTYANCDGTTAFYDGFHTFYVEAYSVDDEDAVQTIRFRFLSHDQ